jgi:transcription elongation GreA/GreB family factor
MSRFFSPANLDRYRKLAGNAIGVAERHQVLEVLGEEMKAFRRESRRAADNSLRSLGANRMLTVTNGTTVIRSNAKGSHAEERPPIVLTTFDREKLFALLDGALATVDSEVAHFLREEIERADIVADDVPPNSLVRMGSEVKFIDHADEPIRRAMLVFPEEAQGNQMHFDFELRRHCADWSRTGSVNPLDGTG